MYDALKASTVVLAALGSDCHVSSGTGSAKSESKPIQLSLGRFPPGEDSEVHNHVRVFGERDGRFIAIHRHRFPVCRRS